MRFEWDGSKNDSNWRKHGVNFLTAREVFLDPLATMRQDRIVDFEERWVAIGMARGRLLYVVFTVEEVGNEEVFRIISARVTTRAERRNTGGGARETDR